MQNGDKKTRTTFAVRALRRDNPLIGDTGVCYRPGKEYESSPAGFRFWKPILHSSPETYKQYNTTNKDCKSKIEK
jgi:hypothetical protein